MPRDLFAAEALAQIPKILTLQDRNAHSPTYGCFDRNYWHYKIIDFPSGMAQEFVWPLALAYALDIPGNPFYHQENLREWVAAGIRFAARSAHPDGSCDDYFPFEKAGGASAFSLLACLESSSLVGLQDPECLAFFDKRAEWLSRHHESGRLTNHQALIALCLALLAEGQHASKWDAQITARIDKVLSWQDEEGWFQEYEGCDPGYHTLTIYCLARLHQLRSDPRIKAALEKAVGLASLFIHPDGSFGGEYGSRNTYNFFPAGFEIVGEWLPEALRINDRFLQGLASGLGPCYADDHIIGHHTWNYFLAWQHYQAGRPGIAPQPSGRTHLKHAGILVDHREDTTLYVSLNKGGCFKLFKGGRLVASDTQFSVQVRQGGKLRNAVGHLVGQYDCSVGQDEIRIAGSLGWAKQKLMSSFNLLALRVVMLSAGRFFPNLIRACLQKVLITGKQSSPFTFERILAWRDGSWHIQDALAAQSWEGVESLAIGCDQTSIYVVMSRTFQMGQLLPWIPLTHLVGSVQNGAPVKIERAY